MQERSTRGGSSGRKRTVGGSVQLGPRRPVIVPKVTIEQGSVGRGVAEQRRCGCGAAVELPRVRIVPRVFELAMGAQIVASRVRGPTQRALEPARKVHVIVITDVRHYFAAQFAPVQVAGAW